MKVNYRKIVIEHGVPKPPDQTRNLVGALKDMGLGDSFSITEYEFDMTVTSAFEFERDDKGKENREFLVDGQHLRVWRTK